MAPAATGLGELENLDRNTIGLTQQLLGEDLAHRSAHGRFAAPEHGHRVGDGKDVVRVVGREHNAQIVSAGK